MFSFSLVLVGFFVVSLNFKTYVCEIKMSYSELFNNSSLRMFEVNFVFSIFFKIFCAEFLLFRIDFFFKTLLAFRVGETPFVSIIIFCYFLSG